MPVVNLTTQVLKNLQCEPGKSRTELCCAECRGLYVEVRATSPGLGTFYLRYKDDNSKTRHLRLGRTDDLSLAMAKKMAEDKKAEIRNGANPSLERKGHKQIPTFREFLENDYLPYVEAKKRSYRDDESRARLHLIPRFGHLKLNKITARGISDLHLELKQSGLTGATCDHYLKVMKTALNYAMRLEIIDQNPAARVPLFREPNEVENYLDDDQLQRLLTVLETHENRTPCHVFLFLLSTGARLNEALTAKWENIDLSTNTWRIEATISKNKKVRYVPINFSAKEVLDRIQPDVEKRSGFLFINQRTGKPLKTVHGAWSKVRNQAGLPHLRIHDMRHLFASFLVSSGRTLYETQQILGHSAPSVTQRYSHISQGVLNEASNAASQRIRAASPRLLPAALPTDAPQDA